MESVLGSPLPWLATLWLYIGALVSVTFLLFGIHQIDEDARNSYTFRPLLIPAILLLWPLVLWRWWLLATSRASWPSHYRALRAAHGRVWCVLVVLIPVIFVGAMMVRQQWPSKDGAVKLDASNR
ncbi:MAG: hypothetical protein ACR2PG_06730 [Hyphomicrobiaceae bacterium]